MTRIAIVHPLGLVGKELRERLGRAAGQQNDVVLVSSRAEDVGALSEVGSTAAIVQGAEDSGLEDIDLAFFCGDYASNRPLLDALAADTAAIVLSPDAPPELGEVVVAGVNLDGPPTESPIVSPHPAVVALALLTCPLVGLGLRRAVATVLQPASMHDQPGLDELFEQTRRILNFEPQTEGDVFGSQLAFNMLPGASSRADLATQLGRLLGADVSVALQLVQAGVFHCFAVSLLVEFDDDPGHAAVQESLAASGIVRPADPSNHLGPIDVAAHDEILIGAVEADASRSGSYWIWAVMDNLTRGAATNALAIAGEVLGRTLG